MSTEATATEGSSVATTTRGQDNGAGSFMSGPVGRNLGLVIAEGRVVAEAPADDLDEHRVLDLIMEGTPHAGAPIASESTTRQHEGDVA